MNASSGIVASIGFWDAEQRREYVLTNPLAGSGDSLTLFQKIFVFLFSILGLGTPSTPYLRQWKQISLVSTPFGAAFAVTPQL